MFRASLAAMFAVTAMTTPAKAEFAEIRSEEEFRIAVVGKKLTRPLVKLEVLSQGEIRGVGVSRDVTGKWTWIDGYFCRELNWGESDLGYNCQEVSIMPDRVRFTSDEGNGDSAVFRLND